MAALCPELLQLEAGPEKSSSWLAVAYTASDMGNATLLVSKNASVQSKLDMLKDIEVERL